MSGRKANSKITPVVIQQILPVKNGFQVCVRCLKGKNIPIEQVFFLNSWEQGLYSMCIEGSANDSRSDFLFLSWKSFCNWKNRLIHLNIPEKIIHKVSVFGNLWLPAAQWCAQNRAAYDLLFNNSVLFWYLLTERVYGINTREFYEQLITQPQKKIIQALGGAGLKSEVRFFKKLILNKRDMREYRMIASALKSAHVVKLASSWHKVPVSILLHLARHKNLPHIGIFANKNSLFNLGKDEVANEISGKINISATPEYKDNQLYAEIMRLVLDTWNMSKLYDQENEARQALRFSKSVKNIQKYHDKFFSKRKQMVSRVSAIIEGLSEESKILFYGKPVFPEPLISGTDDIIAIRSEEDLLAEGYFMSHCIASYKNAILRQEYYVYRVLKPQRATLAIEKDLYSEHKNAVKITDLRLHSNQKPSAQCRAFVVKWIKNNGFMVNMA